MNKDLLSKKSTLFLSKVVLHTTQSKIVVFCIQTIIKKASVLWPLGISSFHLLSFVICCCFRWRLQSTTAPLECTARRRWTRWSAGRLDLSEFYVFLFLFNIFLHSESKLDPEGPAFQKMKNSKKFDPKRSSVLMVLNAQVATKSNLRNPVDSLFIFLEPFANLSFNLVFISWSVCWSCKIIFQMKGDFAVDTGEVRQARLMNITIFRQQPNYNSNS